MRDNNKFGNSRKHGDATSCGTARDSRVRRAAHVEERLQFRPRAYLKLLVQRFDVVSDGMIAEFEFLRDHSLRVTTQEVNQHLPFAGRKTKGNFTSFLVLPVRMEPTHLTKCDVDYVPLPIRKIGFVGQTMQAEAAECIRQWVNEQQTIVESGRLPSTFYRLPRITWK